MANFLSLACNAEIQANYYAFCDQDDIWETDKLQRALDWLQTVQDGVPALYCARTRLVDAENREIGLSPLAVRPLCFVHALTQNPASGNTMVFNHAACALLRQAGANVEVVAHDWWLYLLVTGAGGAVFYDPVPSLRYRQHGGNLVGMKRNWLARLLRLRTLREVWQGNFRQGNDRHIRALQQGHVTLTPQNRLMLDNFVRARSRWLLPRLWGLWQVGVYREPLWSHVGLIAAAIFKKI